MANSPLPSRRPPHSPPHSVTICLPHRLDAEALRYLLATELPGVPAALLTADEREDIWAQIHRDEVSDSIVLLDPGFVSQQHLPRLMKAFVDAGDTVIVLESVRPLHEDVRQSLILSGAQTIVNVDDGYGQVLSLCTHALRGAKPAVEFSSQFWAAALAPEATALTRREREIVELYCGPDAPSTGAVAQALGISENTIRTHLANIRSKLGSRRAAGNRSSLKEALIERGWIPEQG